MARWLRQTEMRKVKQKTFDVGVKKEIRRNGRPSLYNFELMERGDSFRTLKKSAVSAAIMFAARHPEFKFSSQRQDDGSWRIWRD